MIILNLGERVVGMVVDGVSDVIALDPEQIRPAPEFGAALDTQYLEGLATLEKDNENEDERMAIVVDIEKLMTSGDMGLMDQVVQTG
jgi:purine-binding chemotaxis protein CheW